MKGLLNRKRIRWKWLFAAALALCLASGYAGAAAFADVPAGAYYARAVAWAVGKGVTNGTSATMFSPGRGCTRAHAVTFLWRADGCPEPSIGETPFEDVAPGAYYEKAVRWAMEQGITGGIDEHAFGPDQPCSRAQIVTFLYRYAGSPSVPDGIGFRDVPYGVYYARAVAWAAWKGVTQGTADGSFQPAAPCTRGQIVTFLHRYFGDDAGTGGTEASPAASTSGQASAAQTAAASTSGQASAAQTAAASTSAQASAAQTAAASTSAQTAASTPAQTSAAQTAASAPAPAPSPAPPVEQPGKVYHPAVESDVFRERLLSVINSVKDGGGYSVSHSASQSFPRTSWDGIHAAYTLTGDRPVIDLGKARPSFCSSAVYLALTRALLDWDEEGYIPKAAWDNLKPWCLDNLAWAYQHDGAGCWGRANANGPGLAVLLAQLGAGESRYIGGEGAYSSRAQWLSAWDNAVPGDFLKIFWNIYIGADDSQKKSESGHLVIFLGREKAYLSDGTRDDIISYWSSNGSGTSGGYGKSQCRASKIRRAVVTHVTDPAAFAGAAKIAPDAVDAWLSALDGKHLATVAELEDAIAGKDMGKWLK